MPDPLTNFVAGYVAGAVAIASGNPFDIIKVKLQNASSKVNAGQPADIAATAQRASSKAAPLTVRSARSLLHGVAAPILSHGALNALLFTSYSISVKQFDTYVPTMPNVLKIFASGTLAGLSTFFIAAPKEVIKCRTQLTHGSLSGQKSSWEICKEVYRTEGPLGFFKGGILTGFHSGIGYGVYFWTYGMGKSLKFVEEETSIQRNLHLMVAGGLAGCAAWASIFPLDVVKTRYQGQQANPGGGQRYSSAWDCARQTYAEGGIPAFFRGMRVAMKRAFLVSAVQFSVYEWMVRVIESR